MRYLMSMSLACLLVAVTTGRTEAKTIHVHPGPGTPIQTAVNAAKPGDSIHVDDGTYCEQVTIPLDKDNIDIIGEDNTILDGTAFGGKGNTVNLGIDMKTVGCTVRGMTVRNFGVGIVIEQPTCHVKSNTVIGCGIGIQAESAPTDLSLKTTIDYNCASYNDIGISLDGAAAVIVKNNVANNNTDTGIVLNAGTNNCTIALNLACNNGDGNGLSNDGLYAFLTTNNLFTFNVALGNYKFDAEDQAGDNTWKINVFLTHCGF